MAKMIKKPLATALGAAFLATVVAPIASADTNPFSANQLSSGYDLANYSKDGEGSCGGNKGEKEGSCGGDKGKKEGSCGGDKGKKEGSCGGDKGKKEGKCGEGKCGS